MLGYPVSRRFQWDGFLVQAFQKAVLQWRPAVGQFYFVNVFDRLSGAGKDDWLQAARSTPPSFDHSADRGLTWDDVVKRHHALLDVNSAIKASMTIDGPSGNIYLVARDTAANVDQLWRTTNPDSLDASAVRWELIHEFDKGLDVNLFSAGAGPALYASAGYRAGAGLPGSWFGDAGDDPTLIRSLEGGRA